MNVANDTELLDFLEANYDEFVEYMKFSDEQKEELGELLAEAMDDVTTASLFKEYVLEETILALTSAPDSVRRVEIHDFVKSLKIDACRVLFRRLGITGVIELEDNSKNLGTRGDGTSMNSATMMDGSGQEIPTIPTIPDVELVIPSNQTEKFNVIMNAVVQQYVNIFLQSQQSG